MARNSKLKDMSSPTNISDDISQSPVPSFGLIEHHLSRVKKLIDEQMTGPAGTGDIKKLLGHAHCRSSRMIRPVLVLLAGRYCGNITEEHIRVAAIVEIIHNAALLHSYVIDSRRQRHGRSFVNNLCNNETSVLLGDFLLGRVFQMCARTKPQVNEIISSAAVRVCEGQLRQIAQRRNWLLSEPEYIGIVIEKNAVLFSTACRLGALLAQGTDDEIKFLAEYGLNAGISCQIVDDLLDIVNSQNHTTKTKDDNIDNHGLNLAFIHLLKVVDRNKKQMVIDLYSRRNGARKDKDVLLEMLRDYGSLEYVKYRAQEFVTESIGALKTLRECETKDALVKTIRFIVSKTI
ncbi:MAG: polyprenyl synthetase family protein [Sedimentisphaerales bacterium]|nr:polyprenyl synthetase family protein [Sedimentisphaerales bacterium]